MSETKAKRILVVDDEVDVTDLLAYHLRAKGFTVEALNDPGAALVSARNNPPDLVILDVMMPGLTGIQICRLLRADPKLKHVAVVFLTAKAEENDRILGLELGADDYVPKPFNIRELNLRIDSIFRRLGEAPAEASKRLVAGQIVLDVERHHVTVEDQMIELTATEFKLLRLLMERRGRVQSREHLLLNVWNYETEIETRTVDTHVRRLREKLGAHADWIETIRGVGYRLAERRT